MKIKRKEILRTQPFYTFIFNLLLLLCWFLVLFLPKILSWEKGNILTEIIFYTLIAAFIVLSLFLTLRYMEIAIVSNDMIQVITPFGQIKSYKNCEIKVIRIKDLTDLNERATIRHKWIVIQTDSSFLRRSNLNKKDNSFCQIIASPKNITVIKQYADHFGIHFE